MFMSYIDFKPAYTFYIKLSQSADLRNMSSRGTRATSSLPEIELYFLFLTHCALLEIIFYFL